MPTEPNDEDRERAMLLWLPAADRTEEQCFNALAAAFAEVRAEGFAAGSLALAASEARENALREALQSLLDYFDNRSDVEDGTDGMPVPNTSMRCASEIEAALSAPRDSGALAAFMAKAWKAGAVTGSEWRGGKGAVPPPFDEAAIKAIVARILGGGANV